MATRFVRLATLTLGTAAAAVCAFAQGNCEKLTSLKLDHASVVSAENVPAGDFKLPPGLLPSINLPAFCRVKMESKPSNDSLIKIEVWMPVDGWNQKFEQAGNGGLAGSINLLGLGEELKNGFAVAATDDGHQGQGTDGSWAIGHPEKVKDFGYRAVHETSVDAKKVIAAFYQASPKYAYFNGCSEGGREALMEAQRYPDDFDGILAGSPAHYWTKVMMALAWNSQALGSLGAFPSEAKREAVQKAVIAACGTQNRVRDDFVKDPLKCNFDPQVLLCKSGDADSCLTQAQVDALRKVYTGPRNSAGRKLSSGYEPGAEADPDSRVLVFRATSLARARE